MFQHLLVPLDGSEYAERALTYAEKLAERFGSRLSLLSVLLRPVSPGAPRISRLDEQSRERLKGQLEGTAAEVRERSGLQAVQTDVCFGEPAEQIMEFAQSHGVDLIVMSTHGLGATGRYALGSVALKVLMTAPCPVFMVRIPSQPQMGAP